MVVLFFFPLLCIVFVNTCAIKEQQNIINLITSLSLNISFFISHYILFYKYFSTQYCTVYRSLCLSKETILELECYLELSA